MGVGSARELDSVRCLPRLPYCLLITVYTNFSRKRYRLRPRSPLASASPSSVPGVSILRPLKGLDANLYENLESTFTQDYPNYELLLAVEDEEDQALPVVRELMEKHPEVDARVIVGTSFNMSEIHDDAHIILRKGGDRCQPQGQ